MKYPSVRQPEILTEQLRLMNALFRVSLRQHKPRASRTCAQVCKTHLHLSQKREKMRGYTREKMQHTSEGGCDKRKKSYMWKKRTLKACLFELFQQRKDAQLENCVFCTSKYSIKASLRKNGEEKSSCTSGKQTIRIPSNFNSIWIWIKACYAWFPHLLVHNWLEIALLIKTLISMYIYLSIHWMKA